MNRIVGIETEYGCCVTVEKRTYSDVIRAVRDWVYANQLGLVDVHQRDWDEPSGNGGFLFNGGRLYVDMGHLEYCTPECRDLLDVLRYTRAGDMILNKAVKALGLEESVHFIRNNVDHYSGATFGCHENYLVRRSAKLNDRSVHSLLAFLTMRVLFCGAGRVGGGIGDTNQNSYQISQRADYINNDLFEWIQFNRAIINTRDEPLADARQYRRLHLLHGDTNVLPASILLTTGATALVLDLLEMNSLPDISLASAVTAFRGLSHNIDGPWRVSLEDGSEADVIELLFRYVHAAREELAGRDFETDYLIYEWDRVLNDLATKPRMLVGRIDWITKRWMLEEFCDQQHLSWDHPWVRSQDLAYHIIHPEKGTGLMLAETPACWDMGAGHIENAMVAPPQNTRAAVRSKLMQAAKGKNYCIDWELFGADGKSTRLMDPFASELPEGIALK